jgi:TonB family protein
MTGLLVVGGVPCFLQGDQAFAVENFYDEIMVLKGDIQTIRTSNLKRVSVTDPAIADINDARAQAVEVIGLEAGQTVLFIWDESGKRTVIVRVVTEDLGLVQKRIKSLLESAGITGLTIKENEYEGKIVITGDVAEDKNEVLTELIAPLGDRVINLTEKQKVEDLVQIDMQVTELGTTLSKAFGVDWQPTALVYTETLPTTQIPRQSGSFQDLFKVGDFTRTPQIIATVNALITEGKAKVLSKPRLVVISGKEATLLVGGQVPIRTTTTSGTSSTTTENVTFKDYGLSMSITPKIINGKMVNILLNVEISDIDGSNPSPDGLAFLTRSAQTEIVMEDRQTIVLAGMISRRESENINRVPLLGSIPIMGALFRSKKNPSPTSETEVVISITSTIVRTAKDKFVEKKTTAETPRVKEQPAVPPPAGDARAENPVISKVMPPVPPPVVSTPGSSSEQYAVSVQQKILSAIAYPYEAQEKEWEGTAKLTLVLQRDGTLQSVVVKESSGYEVFDQDAVNTAQILAPYAAFPSDIEADEMTVVIPIVYSLDGFLKNVVSQ